MALILFLPFAIYISDISDGNVHFTFTSLFDHLNQYMNINIFKLGRYSVF